MVWEPTVEDTYQKGKNKEDDVQVCEKMDVSSHAEREKGFTFSLTLIHLLHNVCPSGWGWVSFIWLASSNVITSRKVNMDTTRRNVLSAIWSFLTQSTHKQPKIKKNTGNCAKSNLCLNGFCSGGSKLHHKKDSPIWTENGWRLSKSGNNLKKPLTQKRNRT